ncbi:hypothetical protein LEP1GSC058_0479 [Leptospira fainei serovar Hurstbridge str. BUT 6]|uniref:Uncharacterized protein n=1 Tax=Leptospira fainei serovar Hurstbridge str. BUT 6 TaxID=1193011 RepID=S3UZD2_9LEPT|nr:hypothetical protein LEP1GSC058_0479 [Leptospira fainei serovar Hurstbridge str. BUT 6]
MPIDAETLCRIIYLSGLPNLSEKGVRFKFRAVRILSFGKNSTRFLSDFPFAVIIWLFASE